MIAAVAEKQSSLGDALKSLVQSEIASFQSAAGDFEPRDVEGLGALMWLRPSITEIDLRGNGFDSDGLYAVVQALKTMPNVKKLNLRGNTCRNEGVEALAFGECRREATLEAMEDTLVLLLQQDDLNAMGVRLAECRAHVVSQIMSVVPYFKDLSVVQHAHLARTVDILYSDGTLFEQGESADCFFILLEGRVNMYRRQLMSGWRLSAEELIAEYASTQESPWFGEIALAQGTPRTGAARCVDLCKFLVVRKPDFKKFLEICTGFAERLDQALKSRKKMGTLSLASKRMGGAGMMQEKRGALLRLAEDLHAPTR